MIIRDFEVIKLLGQGSYGAVYLARRLSDNLTCALKVIDVRDLNKKQRKDTLNEIRLLGSIQHVNVMRYYQSFVDHGHLHIAMEYVDKGDLESDIKTRKLTSNFYDEEAIWKLFLQVALSMQVLHKENILHRDLKSANILLTSEGRTKLADFGVAKLLKSKDEMSKTRIGTPYYLSPEVWHSQEYNHKSDIWALGVLLYEIACLKYPYDAANVKDLAKKVVKGQYQKLPKQYSKELTQVIADMLVLEPAKRPSIDEVLAFAPIVKRLPALIRELGIDESCGTDLKASIPMPRRMSTLTYDITLVSIKLLANNSTSFNPPAMPVQPPAQEAPNAHNDELERDYQLFSARHKGKTASQLRIFDNPTMDPFLDSVKPFAPPPDSSVVQRTKQLASKLGVFALVDPARSRTKETEHNRKMIEGSLGKLGSSRIDIPPVDAENATADDGKEEDLDDASFAAAVENANPSTVNAGADEDA
eukprot:TRINITY_DN164_c0_g1_i5.p1 TRINITY_DN164_c0_g1~~TRINITY_DN164_c0_g1_i5.p1  ORF type:complete len:474 (+),score=111.83 TRINITY_DN164_c0_g1_i5:51-1472(+)